MGSVTTHLVALPPSRTGLEPGLQMSLSIETLHAREKSSSLVFPLHVSCQRRLHGETFSQMNPHLQSEMVEPRDRFIGESWVPPVCQIPSWREILWNGWLRKVMNRLTWGLSVRCLRVPKGATPCEYFRLPMNGVH